jgi:hypothetical protein
MMKPKISRSNDYIATRARIATADRCRALLALSLLALLPAALAQSSAEAPPPGADGQRVVAQIFGKRVTAADVQFDGNNTEIAAQRLRALAQRVALERFIADNHLQATADDITAFRHWQEQSQKADRALHARQLAQLETQLRRSDLSADARRKIESGRDALLQLSRIDEQQSARLAAPADDERALKIWIEGHKARRALYERYGGRVGITTLGPDPVGASEAMLREHEKRGEIRIDDDTLRQAFWDAFIREPQVPAKPEQIDFTYYWLKPVRGE